MGILSEKYNKKDICKKGRKSVIVSNNKTGGENANPRTYSKAVYERAAMKTRKIAKRKFQAARNHEKHMINLMVNGQPYQLEIGHKSGDVGPSETLAYTLRETLGLTGTKIGCDHGACGAGHGPRARQSGLRLLRRRPIPRLRSGSCP